MEWLGLQEDVLGIPVRGLAVIAILVLVLMLSFSKSRFCLRLAAANFTHRAIEPLMTWNY